MSFLQKLKTQKHKIRISCSVTWKAEWIISYLGQMSRAYDVFEFHNALYCCFVTSLAINVIFKLANWHSIEINHT